METEPQQQPVGDRVPAGANHDKVRAMLLGGQVELDRRVASAHLEPPAGAKPFQRLGGNVLVEQGRKPAWRLLAEQFANTMIVVLLLAPVVAAALGDLKDTVVILAILVLNGLLGFVQLGHALAVRSERESFLPLGGRSNLVLLGAVVGPVELVVVLVASTAAYVVVELGKLIIRRRSRRSRHAPD